MKTAVIFFRSPDWSFDGKYYQNVIDVFNNGGIRIDSTLVLPLDDEFSLRHRIDDFKDSFDNLIIVDSENHPFKVREIVADKGDTVLVENENAVKFVQAVAKSTGKEYVEEYAMLPEEGIIVPNVQGLYQGYILDLSGFSIAVLPSSFEQIKAMSNGYVLPYFENKFNVKSKRLILKYFGDVKKLNEVLKIAKDGREEIQFNVTTLNGDTTVDLLFDGECELVSRDFVREVVENLKENIYAEFDTTLGERLFDLLKLRKVKLSVAESFTGGRVVSELIKNSGASEFIDEGVVTYSNQSKMKRLSVKKIDLDTSGAVSSIVAYQMAVGLLNGGECDIAIATTGIAGPNSDNTEKPVGLCYIAVGMRDGVHTYRYVFKGDREEITETAKNTALFLAIKKLKNM